MSRESKQGKTHLDFESVEDSLEEAPVTLAVLYGSYARGESTETSDVDLAVVFEDSLESNERTTARLQLMERLGAKLETEPVDVVPFADTPPGLRREICEEGIVLVGSEEDLEPYCDVSTEAKSRADRLAEFDDLLADIERVV